MAVVPYENSVIFLYYGHIKWFECQTAGMLIYCRLKCKRQSSSVKQFGSYLLESKIYLPCDSTVSFLGPHKLTKVFVSVRSFLYLVGFLGEQKQ